MLRDFLARTLRGLNPSYFYRQLFFGALIGALWLWMVFKANADAPNAALFTVTVILGVVNTLLYPFARFAYETIMDFIIGSNMFIVNAMFLLMVKLGVSGISCPGRLLQVGNLARLPIFFMGFRLDLAFVGAEVEGPTRSVGGSSSDPTNAARAGLAHMRRRATCERPKIALL